MNTLEKCAEILVAVEYAQYEWINLHGRQAVEKYSTGASYLCDPFADTLEGRRQADAIEDYLICKKGSLIWAVSQNAKANMCQDKDLNSNHKWRLDRIKWCLEELIK